MDNQKLDWREFKSLLRLEYQLEHKYLNRFDARDSWAWVHFTHDDSWLWPRLVEYGYVEKRIILIRYPNEPTSYVYRMTEKGREYILTVNSAYLERIRNEVKKYYSR